MNGTPEFNDFYFKQNVFYLLKQMDQYEADIERVVNMLKRAFQALIRGLGRQLVRLGRSMEGVRLVRTGQLPQVDQ